MQTHTSVQMPLTWLKWRAGSLHVRFCFLVRGGSQRETHFHFKLDFQKVVQHTRGKWLINGTKYRKDNLSPSLELSCRKILIENLNTTKGGSKVTCSNQYSKGMSRGRNIQGGMHLDRKSKHIIQNEKNVHKNPNNSHTWHDEIKLYLRISKRNTKWHPTLEQRTPKNQSYRLSWGATDQCTMSHFTYIHIIMMTSSNGNIFRVTGPLCGDFTGPRWIPRTKASSIQWVKPQQKQLGSLNEKTN